MSDAVDKYFTPTILDESPITQEMCYKSILHYCQILQGKKFPWNMLGNSVERADIHSRIAQYCDCDDDVVTDAIDSIFYPENSSTSKEIELSRLAFSDENFLKNVDKVMDALKDVARLPHKMRYPSLIPEGGLDEIEEELKSIPGIGEENEC